MSIFSCNRIMVVGNNGGGKSYFSKELAAITGLPLVHLDAVYWRPNLERPPESAWRQEHLSLIAGEKWILDGNYIQAGAMEARCAAAELVIFLDVNRFVCLVSAIKRNFNRERQDGPQGFREKWDRNFFAMCLMIWRYPKDRKPKFLALCKGCPNTEFIMVKGRRSMRRLLRQWRVEMEALEC